MANLMVCFKTCMIFWLTVLLAHCDQFLLVWQGLITQMQAKTTKKTQVVINLSLQTILWLVEFSLEYHGITLKNKMIYFLYCSLNTPDANAKCCSFRVRWFLAAAEVTQTPLPTHPPTLQTEMWRVEDEWLQYTVWEEGNEGWGCGWW